jgi:hypothetical protein
MPAIYMANLVVFLLIDTYEKDGLQLSRHIMQEKPSSKIVSNALSSQLLALIMAENGY